MTYIFLLSLPLLETNKGSKQSRDPHLLPSSPSVGCMNWLFSVILVIHMGQAVPGLRLGNLDSEMVGSTPGNGGDGMLRMYPTLYQENGEISQTRIGPGYLAL